jgi:predicted porin
LKAPIPCTARRVAIAPLCGLAIASVGAGALAQPARPAPDGKEPAGFVLAGSQDGKSKLSIYGSLDISLQSQKNATNTNCSANATVASAGDDKRVTCVQADQWYLNSFGFRGSREFDGGLTAFFDLRQGFRADSGNSFANNTLVFQKQSIVGLSGRFGRVSIGRNDSMTTDGFWQAGGFGQPMGLQNIFYGLAGNPGATATANTLGHIAFGPLLNLKVSNSIRYSSPGFNGVTVRAIYGTGEDANSPAGNWRGAGLKYSRDALFADVGYDSRKRADGTSETDLSILLRNRFGFGIVGVGYERYDSGLAGRKKDSSMMVGARIPVAGVMDGKLTFGIQLAQDRQGGTATQAGLKNTRFGLGADYAFDASTRVYVGYDQSRLNAAGARTRSALGAGMIYLF